MAEREIGNPTADYIDKGVLAHMRTSRGETKVVVKDIVPSGDKTYCVVVPAEFYACPIEVPIDYIDFERREEKEAVSDMVIRGIVFGFGGNEELYEQVLDEVRENGYTSVEQVMAHVLNYYID